MIISLTGFMGCGKSSVGRELSKLLGCCFMDLDNVIEERAGRSIPDIFSTDGEQYFRDLEKEVLTDIILVHGNVSTPTVLALGGGTVMTDECERIVQENTTCIYLKASVDTLVEHLEDQASERPLLNSGAALRERILDLMAKRSATYKRTARHIIDTDGKSIQEIANEITMLLTPSKP